MKALELFDIVNEDATEAHIGHLTTESFARHDALGGFYTAARDQVDMFIEASFALGVDDPIKDTSGDVEESLNETYIELVAERDGLCHGDATLENLYDNITATYLSALYKLKRLK